MGACCCTCRWHKREVKGELGGEKTGRWICWAPEFDEAYSDFPEHSMCEMWRADSEHAQAIFEDYRRSGKRKEDEGGEE
jgi:hypothetical protein